MKVLKFGGGILKDSTNIKNLINVLYPYSGQEIIIVVSALGKTTNALEELIYNIYYGKSKDADEAWEKIGAFHNEILKGLFQNNDKKIHQEVDNIINDLGEKINVPGRKDYDQLYDELICYGEKLASAIISHYLNINAQTNRIIPASEIIITDSNHREAGLIWDLSRKKIRSAVNQCFKEDNIKTIVTQGFIGAAMSGAATSLGREGSDYTAAIIGSCMSATEVIIWKDVKGILNADPVFFDNTQTLPRLSYRETIEMAYYGAKVLHPKTIKPLQNHEIPLRIKSFYDPRHNGTIISEDVPEDFSVPHYIIKEKQILFTLYPKDLSMISDLIYKDLYELLKMASIKVNLMQNTAVSFTFCSDMDEIRVKRFLELASDIYRIRYNENVSILTLRHYHGSKANKYMRNKEIILEQKSRNTLQYVVREKQKGKGRQ